MGKERKYTLELKMNRFPSLKNYVIEKLRNKWSPDAISGRLKMESDVNISTETVYQYIYSDVGKTLGLYNYLATRSKMRNRRHARKARKVIIPERISIHDRPEEANQRTEIGHFEADLMFCRGDRSTNIMVITERKTRYSFFVKNESKKATVVGKNLFNTLAFIPAEIRKSVTFDNGTEFVNHRLARDFLDMDTFFCDPHSPWQKGQVEKTNAMLHRYISKKSSLFALDEKSLKNIQNQFNNIPRKVLGYKTSAELLNESLLGVALQT
jgi:IS30 family transposase